MSPTIKAGEIIFINRVAYLIKKPKIRDIVALRDPRDGKIIIKRIKEIKGNTYFVEGDNTQESTDSRVFGWIGKRAIIGKWLS